MSETKKVKAHKKTPIGVFDSGYGGLTILRSIIDRLPQYDYLYLGDNARAPYGTRAFSTIYDYTLSAVKYLFEQNCPLVILACNTASARALRNIQQKDLPKLCPENRVLGIIRPTAEVIGHYSKSRNVGILGTSGTIKSESYIIEISKQFPDLKIEQEACPMWVPLVENGEIEGAGAEYFIQKNLNTLLRKSSQLDTILLACTHYPLLLPLIKENAPNNIKILTQGKIVADSLADYLVRHPEMETRLSKNARRSFQTTGNADDFSDKAEIFFGEKLLTEKISLI